MAGGGHPPPAWAGPPTAAWLAPPTVGLNSVGPVNATNLGVVGAFQVCGGSQAGFIPPMPAAAPGLWRRVCSQVSMGGQGVYLAPVVPEVFSGEGYCAGSARTVSGKYGSGCIVRTYGGLAAVG